MSILLYDGENMRSFFSPHLYLAKQKVGKFILRPPSSLPTGTHFSPLTKLKKKLNWSTKIKLGNHWLIVDQHSHRSWNNELET